MVPAMSTQTATGTTKVAVVGAGSVGATCAYACLIRGIGRTIALYDINADKTRAEVLDLNHGLQFVPQATVVGSDDVEVCRDADLVVITAGAKQKPGQTRLELAEANVNLSRKMIPQLLEVAPEAILLLVTNPVDVITYAALKFSGLPPQQVFGSGTVLDSSRLRLLVADHCGVAVQNVHAYIAGEHGDSEIPLWSSASIGSVPLLAWDVPGRPPLDTAARSEIHRKVVGAAGQLPARRPGRDPRRLPVAAVGGGPPRGRDGPAQPPVRGRDRRPAPFGRHRQGRHQEPRPVKDPADLLAPLRERYDDVLGRIEELVNIDSGSYTPAGVNRVADLCQARFEAGGWEVERHRHRPDQEWAGAPLGDMVVGRRAGARPVSEGGRRLLLLAHMDTVFDEGTAAARPFRARDGRAYGPGLTDDKAGVVCGFEAVEVLCDLAGFS